MWHDWVRLWIVFCSLAFCNNNSDNGKIKMNLMMTSWYTVYHRLMMDVRNHGER